MNLTVLYTLLSLDERILTKSKRYDIQGKDIRKERFSKVSKNLANNSGSSK